jgi:hypothetical protein
MSYLPFILLFAAIAAFWYDSLRARESAMSYCRAQCSARRVQLLDQTVALARLRPRWGMEGFRLLRTYRFEYSEAGTERWEGHLTLLGIRPMEFSLGLPAEAGPDGEEEDAPPPPRLH